MLGNFVPVDKLVETGTGGPRLLALAKSLSGDARFADLKAHPLNVALNQLWANLSAIDGE